MLNPTANEIAIAALVVAAAKDGLTTGAITLDGSKNIPKAIDPSVLSGLDPVLLSNADNAQKLSFLALLKSLQANFWEPWRTVGEPGQPAYENSWIGGGVTQFRKNIFGDVQIALDAEGGASGTTIFTLPDGYWPSFFVNAVGYCDNAAATGFGINTNGAIVFNGDLAGGGSFEVFLCVTISSVA